MEAATFGGGCFWCTEAVFRELKGVSDVICGYAGGAVEKPTYEQVCTGQTGHAEVIRVEFDPESVSYDTLLRAFFLTHDPTTLNRQGADVGTQYRSVVFYHNDAQRTSAQEMIAELDASGAYGNPIVTEVSPLPDFFPAEAYHQDYYAKNPYQGYCNAVIPPKLQKLRSKFLEQLQPRGE